ncbi:hypothetical protein Pelo_6300 [Pelomyxa schiedti]|nr:hypothetical protein Pelo_6300 [Pelomyxa schiedti]
MDNPTSASSSATRDAEATPRRDPLLALGPTLFDKVCTFLDFNSCLECCNVNYGWRHHLHTEGLGPWQYLTRALFPTSVCRIQKDEHWFWTQMHQVCWFGPIQSQVFPKPPLATADSRQRRADGSADGRDTEMFRDWKRLLWMAVREKAMAARYKVLDTSMVYNPRQPAPWEPWCFDVAYNPSYGLWEPDFAMRPLPDQPPAEAVRSEEPERSTWWRARSARRAAEEAEEEEGQRPPRRPSPSPSPSPPPPPRWRAASLFLPSCADSSLMEGEARRTDPQLVTHVKRRRLLVQPALDSASIARIPVEQARATYLTAYDGKELVSVDQLKCSVMVALHKYQILHPSPSPSTSQSASCGPDFTFESFWELAPAKGLSAARTSELYSF